MAGRLESLWPLGAAGSLCVVLPASKSLIMFFLNLECLKTSFFGMIDLCFILFSWFLVVVP